MASNKIDFSASPYYDASGYGGLFVEAPIQFLTQSLTPPSGRIGASTSRSSLSDINLEIEYLRAIAIILVIILHASAFLEIRIVQYFGAHTGVDLFFCISGYVISRSFVPFFERHRHDGLWWRAAGAFWTRRIFRLVPSAWLWLLIAITCSWFFNRTGWFYTFKGNVQSALFVLTNTTNFARASGTLGANDQYWSLALEDQFYFVFPFFLLLVRTDLRVKVLLLCIFLQVPFDRSLVNHPYLWETRVDALMWGCVLYQLSRAPTYGRFEPKFCRRRVNALLVNGALIWLLVAVPHFPYFIRNFRVESVIALVSAGLVFLASFESGYVLPVGSRLQALLTWIGSRSYGIYLIHLPLYGVIKDLCYRHAQLTGATWPSSRYAIASAIAAIVLLPMLAELNFRYVEMPLRRKGKQLAKRIMDNGALTTGRTEVLRSDALTN